MKMLWRVLVLVGAVATLKCGLCDPKSIFWISDSIELRQTQTAIQFRQMLHRRCELEQMIHAIPVTCYTIYPPHQQIELDRKCASAAAEETSLLVLTNALTERSVSPTCSNIVKDKIAVIKYKLSSTKP